MMGNFNLSTKQKIFGLALVSIILMIVCLSGKNEVPVDTNSFVNVAKIQPKNSAFLSVQQDILVTKAAVAPAVKDDACNTQTKRSDCNKTQTVAVVEIKKNMWKMGDVKSQTPSIPLNEKIIAYEAIEIEQHPETFPQIGEQIALPMLHGQTVVVDVQSLATNPNGDKSWSGHLQGYGTDYPVIMTYGENSVFAMITTPEGSYSMESVNGAGWLYKNPSELELSTTGTKDYLEVVDMH